MTPLYKVFMIRELQPADLDRVLSSSYSLKESDDRYAEYRKEINAIFDRNSVNGRIAVPTETVAYIGEV